MLGKHYITCLECDDEARATSNVTLANEQMTILAEMERIRLSDLDFPHGKGHCCIVSVYSVFSISITRHFDDHKQVNWFGPTLIVIRSGCHEKQCACNHALDMDRLLQDERFKECVTNKDEVMPNGCGW